MALGVYCDESDTNGKVFTLAGWAGVPSAWNTFTPAWREMLSCFGPSRVRAFHAVDVGSRRGDGEFARWPRKDRLAFIHRAADLITDRDIMGPTAFAVAASIEIGEFERLVPGLEWTPEDLYGICFSSIFHQVLSHGVEQDIYFVMDEKKAVEERITNFFYQTKAKFTEWGHADKVRGIAFENDEVLIQLQAADYLAYEVRRGILNRRRDPVYVERQPYTRLKEREHSFRCYGEKFIKNVLAAQAREPEKHIIDLWFTVDAPED